MPIDIRNCPVMPARCASCPFNPDGDMELRNRVIARTLFKASQICHHPRLHGQRDSHLCRGARDEQLVMLYRMGLIEADTDAAFAKASLEHLGAEV